VTHVLTFSDWKIREVKNLGWLLRHTHEARHATIFANGLNGNEASLVVEGPGWMFYSPFASANVARDFIRRRRFEGIYITEDAQTYTLSNLRAAAGTLS
jgi:hypothetical protein